MHVLSSTLDSAAASETITDEKPSRIALALRSRCHAAEPKHPSSRSSTAQTSPIEPITFSLFAQPPGGGKREPADEGSGGSLALAVLARSESTPSCRAAVLASASQSEGCYLRARRSGERREEEALVRPPRPLGGGQRLAVPSKGVAVESMYRRCGFRLTEEGPGWLGVAVCERASEKANDEEKVKRSLSPGVQRRRRRLEGRATASLAPSRPWQKRTEERKAKRASRPSQPSLESALSSVS